MLSYFKLYTKTMFQHLNTYTTNMFIECNIELKVLINIQNYVLVRRENYTIVLSSYRLKVLKEYLREV